MNRTLFRKTLGFVVFEAIGDKKQCKIGVYKPGVSEFVSNTGPTAIYLPLITQAYQWFAVRPHMGAEVAPEWMRQGFYMKRWL